jgi:general secretion pathway protein M
MRSWIDGLEPRERVMVATAAVFLIFAVFWFGVWAPLERGERSAALQVDELRLALADLRPLKGQMPSAPTAQRNVTDGNQSLVVIIDSSLRRRGLYGALQRSQPTTANGIRVEFENAAFDDLMLWLGDLSSSYGMHVQSGSFSGSSGDTSGRVNSSLTLER